MSSFDESKFLDSTTTDALTRRPPIPAGTVLPGLITDVKIEPWTSNKPDAKVKSGYKAVVKIEIDLTSQPDIRSQVGIDKVILTPGIMLETTPDGNGLDWGQGKNGALRRYREALGMNNPGETFSLRSMTGRMLLVKIKHRTFEGEFFDEVDSVAKIGG